MIKLSGIIEGISTRKDKTLKLSIGTNELSPEDAANIFQMNQQFCYIALKHEPFFKIEEDILNDLKTDFPDAKTPSQRLRNILYRLFVSNDEGYKDFQTYYISKLETIISHYKSKLDAETY
jgi:hypothetical protein